jgi:uncharacterized membrane protein YhaH (DUF805 family)
MADDQFKMRQWLEQHGFGEYADAFESNRITKKHLGKLKDEHLVRLGVNKYVVRQQLRRAIAELTAQNERSKAHAPAASDQFNMRGWLEQHGFGEYAESFASNDIDEGLLQELTENDLVMLGVNSLGHRKRMLSFIAAMGNAESPKCDRTPNSMSKRMKQDGTQLLTSKNKAENRGGTANNFVNERSRVLKTERGPRVLPTSAGTTRTYGGIRRTGYWLGMFGLAMLNLMFTQAEDLRLVVTGFLIVIPLCFVLVINRLHNIGTNGWWSLLILVPIASLFVGIPCAICPEGYADTKQLDSAGSILAGIFIALLCLAVFLGVLVTLSR